MPKWLKIGHKKTAWRSGCEESIRNNNIFFHGDKIFSLIKTTFS